MDTEDKRSKPYKPDALPVSINRPLWITYGMGKYNAGQITVDARAPYDGAGDFAKVVLCESSLSVEIPKQKNIKGKILRVLESEKEAVLAENHQRLKAVQDKIDNLLAISFKPELKDERSMSLMKCDTCEARVDTDECPGSMYATEDLGVRKANLTDRPYAEDLGSEMSIIQTNAAWQLEGISLRDKAILLALADHASDAGKCWPSVKRLEKRCCASERTVQAALSSLTKRGFISREQRHGRSTVYIVTLPPQLIHLPPQNTSVTPADGAPRTVRNRKGKELSDWKKKMGIYVA